MIMFWILVIAMIMAALFFVLQPLRQKNFNATSGEAKNIENQNELDQQQQNIRIAKERLAELKLEFEQGLIEQGIYEQTRAELEQALLNDIETSTEKNEQQKKLSTDGYHTGTLRALLVIIPVFTIGLYLYLGQPDILDEGQRQSSTAVSDAHGSANGSAQSKLPSIEVMIEKLAERLKTDPKNAEGWFMLGRSYMSVGQYANAAQALEKANMLLPENAVVMLRYADALTMAEGGKIQGKPFELIKKALTLSPNDTTGLWLAGMGYEETGEYEKAISHWNRLLPLLKDDASINEVNALIARTKRKAGVEISENVVINKKIEQAGVSLKVNVSLDKSLLSQTSQNDSVFIFARAVNGPPMPLAVVRKQVKDLPLEVILDDSMAMVPTMKLSSFDKVHLVARISKSGQPVAQPGDLASKEQLIALPYTEIVNININSITK